MDSTSTSREENAFYLADPVGPYSEIVIGASAKWVSLQDDIRPKDKEQDATHDDGCSNLKGSPVGLFGGIAHGGITSLLKRIQI